MTPHHNSGPGMADLYICSLAQLPHIVAKSGAGYIVTLIGPDADVQRPAHIAPQNHLILTFNDINAPTDGLIAPGHADVARLIAFMRAWPADAPVVIHCWAGISRSTAAAFIALCVRQPTMPEATHARRLRAASATATPNRRLVALADSYLERDARMNEAIAAIGRGMMAAEGTPFRLSTLAQDAPAGSAGRAQ